ncbi:MAG: hypothetical protein M5U28_04685 [Sandaracinaceae bacterium]|nr:hypothetical protein [Sandaracinaceae bacterium]
MTLPLAVGTVGGVARVHPVVGVARRVAEITDAKRLAAVCAAAGLAQNLAALRALAAEGIQRGHMRLHARATWPSRPARTRTRSRRSRGASRRRAA